jgi:hypothetical protein
MKDQDLKSLSEQLASYGAPCVRLSFQVTAATINEAFGDERTIVIGAKFPDNQSATNIGLTLLYGHERTPVWGIETSDNCRLQDILGYCSILPRSFDLIADLPIGYITYTSGPNVNDSTETASYPSNYFARIYLPKSQFLSFRRNLEAGKMPSLLAIRVLGLDRLNDLVYGWNSKYRPELPITFFEASFVAAEDASINRPNGRFGQTKEPSYYPATKADFGKILEAIHRLRELLRASLLPALILVLLAFLTALAFFR